MFRMGGRAVVAATFFAAVSGSAMLAAADPAGMVLAQTADSSQERTRQDCIRNGGWYTEGGCEYESKAKAAAMARDKQACERDGGYWVEVTGGCEIESKAKAKQ